MIARIWHGRTPAEKADAYLDYVKKTGIESYRAIDGNRGQYVLRRIDGDIADFTVLTFWDSMDSVRAFAGAEAETPVYYPEDEHYLLELEDKVAHYDVVHGAP